jgi:hypothetical protein
MYSDFAEHLDSLECLESTRLKRAYLALIMQISVGGLEVRVRRIEGVRELLFRDAAGRQPCAAIVRPGSLIFCLRGPMLEWQPGLAAEAIRRFESRLESAANPSAEVQIRLESPADVDEMMEFLRLKPRLVSLGYGAHISA